MSRGISGTTSATDSGDEAFTVNPVLSVLPLPFRKSRKLAPAATSSDSVSGSSFFFFDAKPSRFFQLVSVPALLSLFLPLPSPLKRAASDCCGTTRSSSREMAVSNSLASNGLMM